MFMCVGLHMHKRSLRAHWISGGLFIACLFTSQILHYLIFSFFFGHATWHVGS